jgi:hypothetical protein
VRAEPRRSVASQFCVVLHPGLASRDWPKPALGVRQAGNALGDSSSMPERWVNAVIEIRIPLEVASDATSREKLEAAVAALDNVQMPDGAIASCPWELVEDGEPLGD